MKIVLTVVIMCSCLVLSLQASEKPLPPAPAIKAAIETILKAPAKPIVKGPMINVNDDSLPNNYKKKFNELTGQYEVIDMTNPPEWAHYG